MQKQKTIIEKETTVQTDSTTDAIRVAVMNTEIKHLSESLSRIEGKFDIAISTFVTDDKLADAQRAADAKHKEQDKAIKKLEDQNTWIIRTVGTLLIAAVVGGVMLTK